MRVVATLEGGLALGRALPGRGAWLCSRTAASCLERSVRRGGLARALRRQLAGGAVEALRRQLGEATPGEAGAAPARAEL